MEEPKIDIYGIGLTQPDDSILHSSSLKYFQRTNIALIVEFIFLKGRKHYRKGKNVGYEQFFPILQSLKSAFCKGLVKALFGKG